MTQTVLGFFDTVEAAQQAAHTLQDAGIPAGAIEVVTQEPATGSAFSRFFDHLFSDADKAARYTHAASTSGAVLTIRTESEDLALEGARILQRAGAKQVDDPAVTYESSSSLTGYQAPEEGIVKNEYDPHTYSAKPEWTADDAPTPRAGDRDAALL